MLKLASMLKPAHAFLDRAGWSGGYQARREGRALATEAMRWKLERDRAFEREHGRGDGARWVWQSSWRVATPLRDEWISTLPPSQSSKWTLARESAKLKGR